MGALDGVKVRFTLFKRFGFAGLVDGGQFQLGGSELFYLGRNGRWARCRRIENAGGDQVGLEFFFHVFELCEIFFGQESRLLADWLG